eukprot:6916724-Pyramimonas_sp.AAC.1
MTHIAQFKRFQRPPDYREDFRSGEAALAELLASAPGFSAGSQRVKPCDKDLVSWPDASSAP